MEKEVPVADQKTKHLVMALGKYIRRILAKYPKLKEDMDVSVRDYISAEMEDLVTQ